MRRASRLFFIVGLISCLFIITQLSACSSGSGYSRVHSSYGVGYRGYYHRPWGYRPVYIDGGIDPDWGIDEPIAVPMPEMGMPDMGGGMDMGGFDW